MFGLDLSNLLITIPAILICLTFHEFAHGWVAYKLGDNTAKSQGRLTLNPLRHIDPIGFLCLLFFRFGWAKPVSVDTRNFKNPKTGMALTALAGPAANFILAFVILIIYRLLMPIPNSFIQALLEFLLITAYLSVGLGIFNLIPIPPLDGSNIIMPFLPLKAKQFYYNYGRYIQIAIIALLWLGLLSYPIVIARDAVMDAFIRIIFR